MRRLWGALGVRARLAAEASVLAAALYLTGGIVGTAHHWYWAGTPTAVPASADRWSRFPRRSRRFPAHRRSGAR